MFLLAEHEQHVGQSHQRHMPYLDKQHHDNKWKHKQTHMDQSIENDREIRCLPADIFVYEKSVVMLEEQPKHNLLPDATWKYRKRSRNTIEWPKETQEALKNSYGPVAEENHMPKWHA
eukprot:15646007-Heterocapsa_arctica.AAC.1